MKDILFFAIMAIMAAVICYGLYLIVKDGKNGGPSPGEQAQPLFQKGGKLPVQGAYERSRMFTCREKDAYRQLKPIAEALGYTVFAKVRLLDLLEPVKGIPKYKTYLWKIQAKHVDFVLCDQTLTARYIIALDDDSHAREPRGQREPFVDEVVESVGYKILHVKAITADIGRELKPLAGEDGP